MGIKISLLPAAAATTGAELVPLVQGGVTKQTPISALFSPASSSANIGQLGLFGSTVATTVQKKLSEIESIVNDFGADPTGVADATAAYAAVTALSPYFLNAGTYLVSAVSRVYALGVLGNMAQRLSRTITNSTYTKTWTIDDYKTWTDNSPPVSGGGFISTYYAPRIVYDLTTTSGGVTGDQGVMAKNMTVKGKTYTTVNQLGGITANASAQTVTVTDASAISVGDTFQIDTGANHEAVVATSPTGGTSVSGIFTLNHANGVTLGVAYKGVKNVSANIIGDQAGNTNDMFCSALNANAVGAGPHQITCGSIQTGNNTGSNAYYDAFLGPYISAFEINPYGTKHSTYGINIAGASTNVKFLTGLSIGSCADNCLALVNNGAGYTAEGIVITGVSTHGIIIGSNQTAPTNVGYSLTDPTHGVFFTAKGPGTNVVSNVITWQEIVSSVTQTHSLQASGGHLNHLFNNSATGWFISSVGCVNIAGEAVATTGSQLQIGSGTQSTIGANGGATALTANPLGYIKCYVGSTHVIIPYYNA